MAQSAGKEKERGKFLTFWITLIAGGILVSALESWVAWIKPISFGWYVYATSIQLLAAVELFGIWIWKKWGVYLLTAHQVIAICIIPFYQQATAHQIAELKIAPLPALVFGFLPQVVTILIWFWAIRRKWQYFE